MTIVENYRGQFLKKWITTNYENATSNFSPATVLGFSLFSLVRKLIDITFASAELKRRLLD